MSTTPVTKETRPSGSDQAATARGRSGTDRPGDPEKGKIDPEHPDKPIAMRDRRAYLLEQAQKNQDANDALNEIQVAQNQKFQETIAKTEAAG